MKVIIAGSRDAPKHVLDCLAFVIDQLINKRWEIDEIVSGGCAGPDMAGEDWAIVYGVPVKRFDADWKKHGKAAGPIRNREMADYADAAVVIWDGKSRGSKNMIDEMKKRGKPVEVVIFGAKPA